MIYNQQIISCVLLELMIMYLYNVYHLLVCLCDLWVSTIKNKAGVTPIFLLYFKTDQFHSHLFIEYFFYCLVRKIFSNIVFLTWSRKAWIQTSFLQTVFWHIDVYCLQSCFCWEWIRCKSWSGSGESKKRLSPLIKQLSLNINQKRTKTMYINTHWQQILQLKIKQYEKWMIGKSVTPTHTFLDNSNFSVCRF